MLYTIRDTQLYCERLGRGPPMVCLHGGMGFDHTYLRPWLDPLADSVELVFVDLRGNGRSGGRNQVEGIDFTTWVEDLRALWDVLDLQPGILFGHSFGGFIAQQYAYQHPETLRALILCSTASAFNYSSAITNNLRARSTPESFRAAMQVLSKLMQNDEQMRSGLAAAMPLYMHKPEPKLLDSFDRMQVCAAMSNHGATVLAPQFDSTVWLSGVDVPTLLVSGDDDPITPVRFGVDALHRLLPHSDAQIVAGAGHFPFMERPRETVAYLKTFLQTLS